MTNEQLENENTLIADYHALHPQLKAWGKFVDKRIRKLLMRKTSCFSFYCVQIWPKFRLKSDDSLIKKVFYRDMTYSPDILKKLNDKIGTRVVVTSEIYLKQVESIILKDTKFWKPEVSRPLSKLPQNNPKTFDYRALHINLTPKNKCAIFKHCTDSELEYYTCELQIRTLLQQAFAEVAHDTVYKGVYSNSSTLVRIMSKAEALMEVTDEFFCNATTEMKKEEVFENSLVESLKQWSSKEINVDFNNELDAELTSEIFELYQAHNYDISNITRELTTHKQDIKNMLDKAKSYIIKQPVVLFIAYLLYTSKYELFEKWELEQAILKDIVLRLGHSYGK